MLETNNPDLDIEELEQKVDSELEAKQKEQKGSAQNMAQDNLVINDPYSWSQLSDTLKVAELHVNAGAEVTSMLHYRGVVRKFARFVGKVTVFLGRVITIPQRNFNSSILHSLRIILDGIRDMNRQTALLERQIRIIEEKSAQIDYLKSGLTAQERRVSVLLDELKNQTTAPVSTASDQGPAQVSAVPSGMLDSLYLAFENTFRGSREEIQKRLSEYVPLIQESGAGKEENPILDIGCGRGEWLEIMRHEQLSAKGVDMNSVFVQECQDNGLEVVEGEATAYLRSLPENSFGAITSFHLIEHLAFEERVTLFDECLRVLKPGGVVLFETPNPRNLLIGACNFWADPTHLRPLYPETHKFLLEYRGFGRVELLFLHPHEGEQRLPEEEAPELGARLNEILSCARDYTIVGYKP